MGQLTLDAAVLLVEGAWVPLSRRFASPSSSCPIPAVMLILLLVLSLGPAGLGQAQPVSAGQLVIPDSFLQATRGTPKAVTLYPRLDSGLNRVLAAQDPLAEAEKLGYRAWDGRVQVTVLLSSPACVADMVDWLEERGAISILSAWSNVETMVPIASLAARPGADHPRRLE